MAPTHMSVKTCGWRIRAKFAIIYLCWIRGLPSVPFYRATGSVEGWACASQTPRGLVERRPLSHARIAPDQFAPPQRGLNSAVTVNRGTTPDSLRTRAKEPPADSLGGKQGMRKTGKSRTIEPRGYTPSRYPTTRTFAPYTMLTHGGHPHPSSQAPTFDITEGWQPLESKQAHPDHPLQVAFGLYQLPHWHRRCLATG